MSILSSTKSGKEGTRARITEWLHNMGITNYTLKESSNNETSKQPLWVIDLEDADVNLAGYRNESLPEYIQFDKIRGGNFICSYSKLTTMKGFPKMVGRNLDISFSKIASLEYAPDLVDKDFVACGLSFSKEQIREKTRVTNNVYC